MPGALFAPGDAHPEVEQTSILDNSTPSLRVLVEGVAPVDDHIPVFEEVGKLGDEEVNRLSRLHH